MLVYQRVNLHLTWGFPPGDSGGIHQSGGKRGGPERGCEGGAMPWDATAQ